MKKSFTFLLTLLVLVAGVFATSGSRKAIDKFFKEYEEYIVLYEEAVKSNNVMDLLKLSQKSLEMAEACEEMESFDDWTDADALKLAKLELRLAEAIESSTESEAPSASVPSTTFSIPSFDFGF